MKTKIFTYLILLTLLLGLSSYVGAQEITFKAFYRGPNTFADKTDDILLFKGDPLLIYYVTGADVEVSGLPVLSEDFAVESIVIQGTMYAGLDEISITSPKGTTYVLADRVAGSWPSYTFGAVNDFKIYNCFYPNHNQPTVSNSGHHIRSLDNTNDFIGEDPNGSWKFKFIGDSRILNEDIKFDRI